MKIIEVKQRLERLKEINAKSIDYGSLARLLREARIEELTWVLDEEHSR